MFNSFVRSCCLSRPCCCGVCPNLCVFKKEGETGWEQNCVLVSSSNIFCFFFFFENSENLLKAALISFHTRAPLPSAPSTEGDASLWLQMRERGEPQLSWDSSATQSSKPKRLCINWRCPGRGPAAFWGLYPSLILAPAGLWLQWWKGLNAAGFGERFG